MNHRFQGFVCAIVMASITVGGTTSAALKSTGNPKYDAVVAEAVDFLQGVKRIPPEHATFVAYALLKAGVPVTSPKVAAGIQAAKARAREKNYHGYDHIYLSGVDAMLLADSDEDAHFNHLQNIADYVSSVQFAEGCWSDAPSGEHGDVSMTQYGMLALWAAQRAGCDVSPEVVEKVAAWLMDNGNPDGGWPYRPGTKAGPGRGTSTHNMTMAACGTIAIARMLLHGRKNQPKAEAEPAKFGVLERVVSETEKAAASGRAFPGYSPKLTASAMDARVQRALQWNQARFRAVSTDEHRIYFYYAMERAAALADLQDGWYTIYGDGLASMQSKNGDFGTFSGANVGTSFAVLYYIRSTKQTIDKQYGTGLLAGGRGLDSLFGKKEEVKKDIGPLDALLAEMQKADLSQLDDIDATDIVEKITFGSREELIGQVDLLKKLVEHSDPANRQAAYFALGRTGDFGLIADLLQGLRDPNVDVNVEALQALRYISRKPNGFGLTLEPLAGVETASEDARVTQANRWRTKAYRTWAAWYRSIRPFEEGGGLDEIELLGTPGVQR